MIYSLIAISVIVPIAGVITWVMDGKKVNFKDWVKTF